MSEDKNWGTARPETFAGVDLATEPAFSVEMISISKEEYDCLTAAERERDSLKQQLAETVKTLCGSIEIQTEQRAKIQRMEEQLIEANAELDLNTDLMRKQNAACAEMRHLLEHWSRSADEEHLLPLKDDTDALLASSSAGRDLLERVRLLEELLKAISENLSDPYPDDLRTVMAKLRNGSVLMLDDTEDGDRHEGYNQVQQSMKMLRDHKAAIDTFLKAGGKDA